MCCIDRGLNFAISGSIRQWQFVVLPLRCTSTYGVRERWFGDSSLKKKKKKKDSQFAISQLAFDPHPQAWSSAFQEVSSRQRARGSIRRPSRLSACLFRPFSRIIVIAAEAEILLSQCAAEMSGRYGDAAGSSHLYQIGATIAPPARTTQGRQTDVRRRGVEAAQPFTRRCLLTEQFVRKGTFTWRSSTWKQDGSVQEGSGPRSSSPSIGSLVSLPLVPDTVPLQG